MVNIRREEPQYFPDIHFLNLGEFETSTEAELVDNLRKNCEDALSFVAVDNGRILGHIMFTPAIIEADGKEVIGMGLGPMAVVAKHQRKGIGTQLVEHGINYLKEQSCPFVIVLGHPSYYPRFGFEVASKHRINPQWDGISDESFMVNILDETAMEGVEGMVSYRKEFSDAM